MDVVSDMTAYLLNLFDLACTLEALRQGVKEANPFMQSVPVMIFYKVVVVGGLLLWLSNRPERAARYGIRFCTAVYAVLALYHIIGISMIE